MDSNDEDRFAELMTVLQDLYDKKLGKATIETYWNVLKKYPLERIEAAFSRVIESHIYANMPKPAHFIEYLNPAKDLDSLAFQALQKLESRFSDNGYTSLCFDDPIIHYVVDNYGGWIRICEETYQMGDKEYGIWKHGFLARYKAFYENPPTKPVPRLIGTHELNNRNRGYLTDDNMLKLTNGGKQPAGFIENFVHEIPQIEDKQKLPEE